MEVKTIGLLDYILRRNESYDISDWQDLYELNEDTHLRQMAIDTVLGKIQSTASLIIFDTSDAELNYRLNTRPNRNQSAVEFRDELLKRMIMEGEALVVMVADQLLIADSWQVSDDVVKERTYSDVQIGGLKLKLNFPASEVFYFKYRNDKLQVYLKQLTESYAKLFSRMLEVQMRESQLRVYANFKGVSGKNKENQEKFVKFLRGLTNALNTQSVVVSPRQDDYDIDEKSPGYLGRSSAELGVIENIYLKNVANALQVPPLLFSGDLADISQHKENFILYCIQPLMEIIVTEFNAKYFRKSELKDKRLRYNTMRLLYASEFAMAKDVEKMIGSGVWTIDDVLELKGDKRLNTITTTQRYITKNHAPLDENGNIKGERTVHR